MILRSGLLLTLIACGPPVVPSEKAQIAPPAIDEDMLRVDGQRFVVGDRPVRWVGVNAAMIHGEQTRTDMPRLIDAMASDQIRVARVWALGESVGDEAWRRNVAFRLGPEDWVEESFVHLDRMLAEAHDDDLRVILVLANRWGDRGGLPQYARWAGIEPRRRNLLPAELAAVLANETIREMYVAHLERIVGRTNTITDRPYREDPTIAAWELFNEISAPTCAVQEALVPWIEDMAARIRALDSAHLIAAGHIGYNSEQSLRFWEQIHRLDSIAYADTHGYPQNLLDATNPQQLGRWLDHRAARARALGKPLLVGEVGIPRRDAFFADRVGWFRTFFEHADVNGTDGVLLWIYRPWQDREDQHGIWSWGPFEEESKPVRELLFEWSKRWATAGEEEEVAADFPLGIRRIRPYVEGEWSEGRFTLDPWALSEGCATDESAWLDYSIPWDPSVERVALELPGEAGTVRLHIGDAVAGLWRDGEFETSDDELPAEEITWLRLEAQDAEGAALLRRFTRELPGDATITIRAL